MPLILLLQRRVFPLLLLFVLTSCSRESLLVFVKPPKKFAEKRTPIAPNYALQDNWHYSSRRFKDKEVDVFFVHPTTYIKARYWNQPLDHIHTNNITRLLPLCYQASAFYEDCNVFIPKYRQAAFYSFVDKKDNGKQALELAYQDVKKAFKYYWRNNNKGRPFIIAGHSQGSLHSKRLLVELMQDTAVRQQLIVAYAIGWPIKEQYVLEEMQLEVCSTDTQTNCLISWNAQHPTIAKSSIKDALKIEGNIVCVNPLTWTTDTSYANKMYNRGALMPNHRTKKDEILLHYADAQIKDGLLMVAPSSGAQRLQTPLRKGNYHLYDYNFFYQNIKDNIKTRIAAHKKHLLQSTPL